MKIKLIKDKSGYYDLDYLDALSGLKKNSDDIINVIYSNKKAEYIAQRNLDNFDIVFPEIAKAMNQHHRLNLSNDFWRILIGPWLFKSLEFFYDKYNVLNKLPENKKYIIEASNYKNFSFDNIYDLFLNEKFINYSIYILNQNKKNIKLKNYKLYDLNKSNLTYQKKTNTKFNKLKYIFRKIFYYFSLNKKYRIKILNINTPLDKINLKNISDKNNNLYDPYIYFLEKIITKNKNRKIKYKIDKVYKDDFLNCFKGFILDFVPLEYTGSFDSYFKININKIKAINPSVVIVRSPHETHPQIRYFLATLKEIKRTNIVSFQEGGIGKYFYQKFYERFSLIGTDYFFQWSKYKKEKNIVSFYLTKTFWLKNYNLSKKNNIIFILGSFRKFFFSSYEGQLPDYSFKQLKIISDLLNDVSIKSKSTIRFHKDFGFKEKDYLITKYSNLNISTREDIPFFYDLLEKHTLKIFFSDYTANMQSFIINHPSIFIWDKKLLKPNQRYTQVYIELERSNILFFSTKKLKKFINEEINTYKKLNNWWKSKEVQNAKNNYLSILCRQNKDFQGNLVNQLNKISKT